MTQSQITSILHELDNILTMLQEKGVKPSQHENVQAASLLKADLKDNQIKPTQNFFQRMLGTAKELFPLVVPIIKALL